MSFHAKNGWYFERDEDGSVVLEKGLPIQTWGGPKPYWPVEHVRFDERTWASIVASVCARGENGETFQEALSLHSKEPEEQ